MSEQRAIQAAALAFQKREWAELIRIATELARTSGSAPGFVLSGTDDIYAPLPPINWLIPGLDIAPGAPTLVAGYGFSGKTVSLQALAIALALERADSMRLVWGLFPGPVEPCSGVHIDWEQGAHLTRTRYQRMAAKEALGGRLSLCSLANRHLDGPGAVDALLRAVEGKRFALIDSLRAACPGLDENSSEIRGPLDMMTSVSERTGCCFFVVHHARKPSKDAIGGQKYTIRGSGALFDACQSVLVFSAEKGKPALVVHEKARITGRIADDFTLTVSDLEGGGLAVRGAGVVGESEDAKYRVKLEAMAIRIVALMTEGSIRSREELLTGLRRTGTVGTEIAAAAFAELKAQRVIINTNTERSPIWELRHDV